MGLVSRVKARFRQFQHAWKRDGLKYAITTGVKYVAKNPARMLFGAPKGYQTSERVDIEERWELITERLRDEHKTFLDIGCNEGEITRRAANTGLFAIGVDQGEIVLDEARRKTEVDETCYFLRFMVEPDNVSKLPSCDVTFLSAVYYHWGRGFGWEEAEEMLRIVANKTDTLFF